MIVDPDRLTEERCRRLVRASVQPNEAVSDQWGVRMKPVQGRDAGFRDKEPSQQVDSRPPACNVVLEERENALVP